MIIKIHGEHNFFKFQDIVVSFIKFLQGETFWCLEKKNSDARVYNTATYFVAKSWLDVFVEKLLKSEKTNLFKRQLESFKSWMITTNIAITTAQIKRGREGIPSCEIEAIKKYKPTFPIELSDDFEIYTVYLEDEIQNLFEEALYFHESLSDFQPIIFKELLKKYYSFEDEYLEKEIKNVCEYYAEVSNYQKYIKAYELERENE